MPEFFTEEEKRILEPFVTNTDKPIFVLRNLPEVIKGALFSRYSRSAKGLRRLLLDEFINSRDVAFEEIASLSRNAGGNGDNQLLAVEKAKEFYDRILDGFGDDSIGELGGAHLACEEVSIIASKVIEDTRIGGSPLEKSTRYVFFDKKIGGDYQFYKEPILMDSEFAELYLETCRFLFDTYSRLVEPMKDFIKETTPREEGVSDMVYNFSVRARACDALRGLLPAATLTNLGLFGNGRFFEYLLLKLRTHELSEMRHLADVTQGELDKVIPSFVRKAKAEHIFFKPHSDYIIESRLAMQNIACEKLSNSAVGAAVGRKGSAGSALCNAKCMNAGNGLDVELVDYDEYAGDNIVAMMLYPHSKLSIRQLREIVRKMPAEEKENILHEALHRRMNRRHKPGRAFENVYYTFDILGDYGVYRDLQRHRILTQERQDLTVEHDYIMPNDITLAGFEDEFKEAMQMAADAYYKIAVKFPKEAQYVVPLAYRIRWYNKINLRALYWLIELRSGKQGHAHYRKIVQEMYKKVKEVHPILLKYMKFVDLNDYSLGRLDAEKEKEQIQQKLEKGELTQHDH